MAHGQPRETSRAFRVGAGRDDLAADAPCLFDDFFERECGGHDAAIELGDRDAAGDVERAQSGVIVDPRGA